MPVGCHQTAAVVLLGRHQTEGEWSFWSCVTDIFDEVLFLWFGFKSRLLSFALPVEVALIAAVITSHDYSDISIAAQTLSKAVFSFISCVEMLSSEVPLIYPEDVVFVDSPHH